MDDGRAGVGIDAEIEIVRGQRDLVEPDDVVSRAQQQAPSETIGAGEAELVEIGGVVSAGRVVAQRRRGVVRIADKVALRDRVIEKRGLADEFDSEGAEVALVSQAKLPA